MPVKYIVRTNARLDCGGCDKTLAFAQGISADNLPVMISCPYCQYRYLLDADTASGFIVPKHDPSTTHDGCWHIDFTWESSGPGSGQPDAHEVFKQAARDEAALPPQLAALSAHDKLREISAQMLMTLRLTRKLTAEIEAVAQQFANEIHENVAPIKNLGQALNPKLVQDWLLAPFISLPLIIADEPATLYGRMLLAPSFYQKQHGIPMGSSAGYSIQLICPYSLMETKIPAWLQATLELPPLVSLQPLKSRIVGESLPFLWKSIPGVETASDHNDANPAVQMTGDTIAARSWLAKHGCPGWRTLDDAGGWLPVKHDWAIAKKAAWTSAYWKLLKRGRLLFASPTRRDRLLFAQLALQCYVGRTAIIYDKDSYDADKSKTDTSSFNTDWIDWKLAASLPDLNHYSVIAIEADVPQFHELIPHLYRYANRLLILTGDPLFDLFEANTWAPVVYGLCNSTFYWVERFFKPYAWRQRHKEIGGALQAALMKIGFIK